MITGVHAIIYSKNPEADRAFLRDVLKFTSVDAGEGWLIFGLPPAELAVHPSEKNDIQEIYLQFEDVQEFVQEMLHQKINCDPIQNRNWGLITWLTLPGGGKLGVYQPSHARPGAVLLGK